MPANDNRRPFFEPPAPPPHMLRALVVQAAERTHAGLLEACGEVAKGFPGLTAWKIIEIIGGPHQRQNRL